MITEQNRSNRSQSSRVRSGVLVLFIGVLAAALGVAVAVAAPQLTESASAATSHSTTTSHSTAAVESAPVARHAQARVGHVAVAASAPIVTSYTVPVRVAVNASTQAELEIAQAAINTGGQVAIDYTQVGVTDISAHTQNDPLALHLAVGDQVTFTGAMAGTYRVSGAVLVPHITSSAVLAQLGTPVVMQTCDGLNLMRVVGLVRI